jgi:hypothetical protein
MCSVQVNHQVNLFSVGVEFCYVVVGVILHW